jgi:flavoprotein
MQTLKSKILAKAKEKAKVPWGCAPEDLRIKVSDLEQVLNEVTEEAKCSCCGVTDEELSICPIMTGDSFSKGEFPVCTLCMHTWYDESIADSKQLGERVRQIRKEKLDEAK